MRSTYPATSSWICSPLIFDESADFEAPHCAILSSLLSQLPKYYPRHPLLNTVNVCSFPNVRGQTHNRYNVVFDILILMSLGS
jgi:hypothetical protein